MASSASMALSSHEECEVGCQQRTDQLVALVKRWEVSAKQEQGLREHFEARLQAMRYAVLGLEGVFALLEEDDELDPEVTRAIYAVKRLVGQ